LLKKHASDTLYQVILILGTVLGHQKATAKAKKIKVHNDYIFVFIVLMV
jgi:hypothetical protein